MIFELAQDFNDVVAAMPREHPKHRMLELLEEAIRRDVHFIARHPTTLFQCMWNTCWWYDCPEATEYYEEPQGGWPTGEKAPPWFRPGAKLSSLLQIWRCDKEKAILGFAWVRSLRPPPIHLNTSQRAVLRGHTGGVTAVAYSPDGYHIVSGSLDKTVRIWDLEGGGKPQCLYGHEEGVTAVAYSPDGNHIVSGSLDKTVRIWDLEGGGKPQCLYGHEERVTAVAYSPDGHHIVSGSLDKTVRIWDLEGGGKPQCPYGHEEGVTAVAYSPDGHHIVSGSLDKTVRIWDLEGGGKPQCPYGHEEGVTAVAYSPDGNHIVSGSLDKTVRVWDLEGGGKPQCPYEHEEGVTAVAYSPDGRRIVSGSGVYPTVANSVRVWDAQGVSCLNGHESCVTSVAFSPKEDRIASGSLDQTIRLWDAKGGTDLRSLHGHRGSVRGVEYSPDGRYIVSVASDKTVRVWDAESGLQLRCLDANDEVFFPAFTEDGCHIVVSLANEKLSVWDAQTFETVSATTSSLFCSQTARLSRSPLGIVPSELEMVIDSLPWQSHLAWFPEALPRCPRCILGRVFSGAQEISAHLNILRVEGSLGETSAHEDAPPGYEQMMNALQNAERVERTYQFGLRLVQACFILFQAFIIAVWVVTSHWWRWVWIVGLPVALWAAGEILAAVLHIAGITEYTPCPNCGRNVILWRRRTIFCTKCGMSSVTPRNLD